MNLIAIDPGKTTGWAAFLDGKLYAARATEKAELFKLPSSGWSWPSKSHPVIIEMPRWYPHDQKDTNDLLDLSVLVGEYKRFYESQGCTVELVFPRTWKGTVPKPIHNKRVLAALTPDERRLVPLRPRAKTPDHNAVDAIGLGLWKLGRMR